MGDTSKPGNASFSLSGPFHARTRCGCGQQRPVEQHGAGRIYPHHVARPEASKPRIGQRGAFFSCLTGPKRKRRSFTGWAVMIETVNQSAPPESSTPCTARSPRASQRHHGFDSGATAATRPPARAATPACSPLWLARATADGGLTSRDRLSQSRAMPPFRLRWSRRGRMLPPAPPRARR